MIIALDIGTSSVRAITFSKEGQLLNVMQEGFSQIYPQAGWVEQDADTIVKTSIDMLKKIYQHNLDKNIDVAALGIANQRESIVVWEKCSGKPIYNAIIWQDNRTEDDCEKLKQLGVSDIVRKKTGLFIDPYFSASKISWILNNVTGARSKAENGELLFGTIDTYIIYQLTKGHSFVTDATNASRTSLYNINTNEWDKELFSLFNIPLNMAPEVLDSAADFGCCDASLIGKSLDITGVAGDQQAATFGQCCFDIGDIKATFGTGCFALMNVGTRNRISKNKLLSTIAYRLKGENTYAIEGSVFAAGSVIRWLKENVNLISEYQGSEAICRSLSSNNGVYFIPAFNGLGAPHWRPDVRGSIVGITRATTGDDIVRAGVESVVYQTHDLIKAMQKDEPRLARIKVDGGMTKNTWLMQFLSDVLKTNIDQAKIQETSALGVAFLAGLGKGVYSSLDQIREIRQSKEVYIPKLDDVRRTNFIAGWNGALEQCLGSRR